MANNQTGQKSTSKVADVPSDSESYPVLEPRDRHPDPILSRLLLNDQFGKPIQNPKLFFRDCKVVGFFFSSIWKYDRESFQQNVMELCNRNPHRFKCIYVSIDSTKQDFISATKDKPWINMIWDDGSNMESEEKPKIIQKVDFITPIEQDLIKKIIAGKLDIKQDSRFFSRVGLCAGLEVLFAPTLMIYHLESRTWLEHNVSHGAVGSREKREIALETWEKGQRLTLSIMDILVGLRWAILISTVGIVYFILVRADDSYNLVHLVEWFMSGDVSSSSTTATTAPSPISAHTPPPPLKSAHEYVEF
ncbi:hypothetical protein MJO28_006790 [Puccinia striiformis f. sp. tritici]|uniref:Uncharacterized protein n=2 Tax=Puccinia striiformis f. sp. tritici TaxID=168172 RepID=A0A0L0V3H4_9BASI|nr:hypothetical protein Pst134EA_033421 [Puccinia striiformis f. sp. tritici]KAI9631247.1 hypothetical protein KEM48_013176 [Puccinia striiformis f. sp. tritici PST-130]KNE93848.1 hypothetical protein PSTG_12761 [Puccinia striiformis f. sp. tritici PST-78]KAH9456722.1 hypothetical protein Pst134EB_012927 [Puccinia striiformis f. sp. tritici]KAH9468347.1 hypothetical protein Pst134EA_033421 [Puccinia striiformis f. sp. tritici]KAI7954243.1 hypothetical protein MJO28_006790 [Puccinia striiformis